MSMHFTLSVYIGRLFAFWFAAVFAGIAGIVYMLDSIELLRRSQRVEVPLSLLLKLSALKLPQLLMELFPFVVLFAAMLCFWRLARSHELTVVRASGVSVWQFLTPVIVLVLTIGAVRVGLVNPLAAALYSRHETLEAEIFQGRGSQMAVAQNGFWLRQAGSEGNAVIHALRVASERMELFDVIISSFSIHANSAGSPLPSEQITMSYSKVEWNYCTIDPKTGDNKGNVPGSFDVSKNSTK